MDRGGGGDVRAKTRGTGKEVKVTPWHESVVTWTRPVVVDVVRSGWVEDALGR